MTILPFYLTELHHKHTNSFSQLFSASVCMPPFDDHWYLVYQSLCGVSVEGAAEVADTSLSVYASVNRCRIRITGVGVGLDPK